MTFLLFVGKYWGAILLLLRKYWGEVSLLVIAGLVFYSGWSLRGLREVTKEQSAIIAQSRKENKISGIFENDKGKLDTYYNNINTKATYENTYSCPIPADGVRLLAEASR